MRHADALARNILRCGFVERLVLSNHNPAVRLADHLSLSDARVVVNEERAPMGCGHRWQVAVRWPAGYLIVIDDDILLRPEQLRTLFHALQADPARPHGIAGMRRSHAGTFEFVERRNDDTDFLCEVYAVTGEHLDRYVQRRDRLPQRVRARVDRSADFVLISACGNGRPRLHDVGRVLRCESFKAPGIAVHQGAEFHHDFGEVSELVASTAPQ
jgi:hypothetical protein